MQYNNRQSASTARAVIKTTYAALSIAIVIAFLGDGLEMARWALVALLFIAVAVTTSGGLYEVALAADNTYVEVMCNPILQAKGRSVTFSIQAGDILKVRHLNLLIFHYLTIDYIGHRGQHKQARVGLTLINKATRDKLLKCVESAAKVPRRERSETDLSQYKAYERNSAAMAAAMEPALEQNLSRNKQQLR